MKEKTIMKANNASEKKGILLISEDEIEYRDILVEILRPVADEIRVAGNGQEALQIVLRGEIDAVLTDIKMPIMSGLQFLAEVRGRFIQTPVIVLTGQGDFENIQEALRLDATDFVEKPAEDFYLISAVKKALAFGLALRSAEFEIDRIYEDSLLPVDKIAKLKKIKRITSAMKLGFSSYIPKKVSNE